MTKIICEECKYEIQADEDVIETFNNEALCSPCYVKKEIKDNGGA